MVTDRITLAHAFENAGIERAKAEEVAQVIIDAIHDNVATKADLRVAMADLRVAIGELKHDLTIRGITALIAAGGILFAALHYWPPGH